MYIHRLIIRGMKGFPNRDITFYNDWRDEPLSSVFDHAAKWIGEDDPYDCHRTD